MSSLLKDILRVSPSIENLLEEDKSANKRVLINYSSSILFSVHTEERERINIINKGQWWGVDLKFSPNNYYSQ